MPENPPRVPMVRCPNCGNLSAGLSRYTVYRCGNCGAVLRAAEKGSSVTDDLSEKSSDGGRSGDGSRREGNGGRAVGVDLVRNSERRTPRRVSKSPVRPRYADATRKSPMRRRAAGVDSDGGIVEVDPDIGRVSRRVSKSPLRERNLGADNGKSPLRGRMSADSDAQSKFSGRCTDGDVRKSLLAANPEEIQERDKVGAWFKHVKEEVGFANKLVTPTESFNGWLPGEETTDQDQTKLNKPSVSPRKRRTWSREDPSIGFGLKQIPEQVCGATDQIGLEYRNFRSQADEEGDYGGITRNADLRFQEGYVEVYERPRGRMEHWEADRVGFHVHGHDILPSVRQRAPIDYYEAPSNYHSYGYDELRSSHPHYDGPANLQNVAMKQAELIRKYNELGQELHRIGDLPYNHGGLGVQADFYGDPDEYVHDEFLRVRRGTVQSRGFNGSPRMRHNYISGRPVPVPVGGGHYDEDIHSFLPSRFMPNEVPFHEDPDSPRTPRRTTHREPHYYNQQLAQRRPMDSTYDPRAENLHQQQAAAYDYKRHPNSQTHQAPDYPDAYGKRTLDSTFRNPTPNNLSSRSRTLVDSKSDGSSSAHDRAKRVLVVNQNQQLCHPIAGGAPFLICSNCSQLLRLPQKLRSIKNNQYKMQCGSCRTISSFDFGKKSSHSSVQTNSKPIATDVCDVPIKVVSKFDDKNTPDNSVADITHRESYDIKSTGYTFPRTDSEPSTDLEDRTLNPSGTKMRPGLSPSSSQASKDDNISEAVGEADDSSSKTEKPSTKLLLRPPPGSPLRYHLDYSDMLAARKSGGKDSDASSQDKGTAESDSSSVNYEENAAVPSKLDQNSDDVLKIDASQGSMGFASVRKDQGGNSKGGQSPFTFINTGFQDPSLPSLNISAAEADVFVNGQSITHDAVIRAEKMAGSIKPGEYWYDSRAGFWGLIGSPCLGIVAPFIKEFKTPMPENCSGGDTCIYVNGRELHKKDLDVLSDRRLPRTRYKYYIIDISGKVEDEDTGRFVVNLGKLAPNVERTGRGFGMQPPEMKNG